MLSNMNKQQEGRILVAGVSEGNLGFEIAHEVNYFTNSSRPIQMWGLDHHRDVPIGGFPSGSSYQQKDLRVRKQDLLRDLYGVSDVFCAIGVNDPDASREWIISINYVAIMNLMEMWLHTRALANRSGEDFFGQFVVVSSNSAHVARSGSEAYCASKAAISMGVRCMARGVATSDLGGKAIVYGWEPGFIADTPMSVKTGEQFPGVPLHRIPGGNPLSRTSLAKLMASTWALRDASLNGCLLRIDGGEQ